MLAVYEDKLAMLDVEIAELVRTAHIPTQGLETHAFQDALIEELMDVRMLRATVRNTPDRRALEREAVHDLAEYCDGRDDEAGTDHLIGARGVIAMLAARGWKTTRVTQP